MVSGQPLWRERGRHLSINGRCVDYSINGSGGLVVSQRVMPANIGGIFALTTCALDYLQTPIPGFLQPTIGKAFAGAWYAEFNVTWDATGHPNPTTAGKPDFFTQAANNANFGASMQGYEVDNPEMFAFGRNVVSWFAASAHLFCSSSTHNGSIVETNSAFGALATISTVTRWFNGTVDGGVTLDGGHRSADVIAIPLCRRVGATPFDAVTVNSFRVSQAGPAPPPPVSGGRWRFS